MTMQMTSADAWESTRDARAQAERALRRSEIERDRAGRALEMNLRPMSTDETERARLRAAYAAAAAIASEKRRLLDRAVALESAVKVITEAIDDGRQQGVGVDDLLHLLSSSQGPSRRTAVTRGRAGRVSSPLAGRGARRQDSQPQ